MGQYENPLRPSAERYELLSEADLEAVYALHLAATSAVGRPELIKPETRDFFRRLLAGGGRIIGAVDGDRLLGYGVLQLDLPPSEDARPLLGLAPQERLAKLAGASVLPDIWGRGIHDALIDLRIVEATKLGVPHLYATAAPGNARSWQNLMDAGFAVRGIVEKYGGHVRYILHRDLGADQGETAEGIWCPASDTERQRELLGIGHAGMRWRKLENGGREIWYRRPS